MSEENVEIVRSAFGAFERGELDEMFELVTNDLITHRVEPDNAIYHGKEGFRQATADWIEGFEEWTVTPEEFIEGRDSVLVRVRQTARGEKSGVPVESNIWFAFEMRGGKIARLGFHLREAEALEAAGLSQYAWANHGQKHPASTGANRV
jgi:ketosteroid isomerase-like protein